jgi:endonuclease YncB( thermonuclease family)
LLLLLGWILAAAGPAQAARQLSEPSSPAPGAEGTFTTGESGKATIWGTVRAVHDGKSLTVVPPEMPRIEVRLLGVEPPELPRQGRDGAPLIRGQPFGPEAVKYLRDLVMDKQVRLEVHGKDRAGRTLAVVWLGDISVNLALVKEGFAWVSPRLQIPNVRAGLEVAERQAQVGKYGLWALPGPEPPWEYRSRHHLPAE